MLDIELLYGDTSYEVALDKTEGPATARIGEESFPVDIASVSPNCVSVTIGNRRRVAFVTRSNEKVFVQLDGRVFEFEEAGAGGTAFAQGLDALGGGSVSSPMPGRVVKIPVEEGREVEKGDTLVIVEAMKMENPLRSPIAGKVTKVNCAEGDLVDAGAPLVEVEAADSTEQES